MASLSEHHRVLTDGVGRCSVPMWRGGVPADFCDAPAYGSQEKGQTRYADFINGRWIPGYCSGLACYPHGGPSEPAPRMEK